MANDLTDKQARFVLEYLVDLNATQAAIRAGYPAGTARQVGSQNLSKLNIMQAIAEHMTARAAELKLTQAYVIEGLMEVVQRCMQRAPVLVRRGSEMVQKTDEEGEGVWKFDAMGANAAFKLLGQHLALFTKNLNLQTPNLPNRIILETVAPPADDDEAPPDTDS